jgi:triacylglycerol esterase/lipase EstA (alpha/beta hydrolase family)
MKLAAVALAVLVALSIPSSATAAPAACKGEPVVLVHGTFGDSTNWGYIRPQLEAQGYCTYALDYGNRGTGDIRESARQLADFVDGVRAQSGAAKVDIVGHSQGGMMPRYYIKNLGGAEKVDDLIGLSPSNHGTTIAGSGNAFCTACDQQAAGSEFLTELNAGDETPGDVDYTVIQTRYDEVVVPYSSAFLDGAVNVLLQDKCPADVSDHLTIMVDQVAVRWILNALDASFAPRCV